MQLEVFDNFLPPEEFKRIQETLTSPNFPWFFINGKSSPNEANKNMFQFVHMFYMDYSWRSEYSSLLDPFIHILQPVSLIKVKANLTTISEKPIQSEYHRDVFLTSPKSKTACFYLNTNNGYTKFNNNQIVESVANRLAVFDAENLHAGVNQTDETTRIVINFNFFSRL